ncbi:MAG: 1,6-anhydro-N-acetylmuramyl-L-alanine amidase AmpD [Gammaproteobacteria bacterium]
MPSRNVDLRGAGARIELLVMHCISLPPGQFGTGWPAALLAGTLDTGAHPSLADLAGVRVSAHLLIDRHGRIVQFVPFDQRAWHAGVSAWRGRSGCNRMSIGIELEGTERTPYAEAQYRVLTQLLPVLMARYPALGRDTVVGHAEIAPGRKRDPGPHFDWVRVLAAC